MQLCEPTPLPAQEAAHRGSSSPLSSAISDQSMDRKRPSAEDSSAATGLAYLERRVPGSVASNRPSSGGTNVCSPPLVPSLGGAEPTSAKLLAFGAPVAAQAGSHPYLRAGGGSGPSATIEVVCGDMRGVMLLPKQRILLNAGTPAAMLVSPTEFERMGGRGSCKQWRSSIRVTGQSGGRPIGEWLIANGYHAPTAALGGRAPRGAGGEARVNVVCGAAAGVMVLPLKRIRVDAGTPEEVEVSPTEFERLGGRATFKRWRRSIRLAEDGLQPWGGCPIGEWLIAHGYDAPGASSPKASSPPPSDGGRPEPLKRQGSGDGGGRSADSCSDHIAVAGADCAEGHVTSAAAGGGRSNGGNSSVDAAAAAPAAAGAAVGAAAATAGLEGVLPIALVSELQSMMQQLVRKEEEQKRQELTKREPAPKAAAPAIQQERQACPLSLAMAAALPAAEAQEPAACAVSARARPLPGDGSDAVAAMADYLAGVMPTLPARLAPVAATPLISGRPLDLRTLFRAVVQRGGHLLVTLTGRWGEVLQELKLEGEAATAANLALVQGEYERLLLRFERMYDAEGWLLATGRPSPVQGTTSAAAALIKSLISNRTSGGAAASNA